MNRTRWIVPVVGAAAGLYFAVLCAFSIGAVVFPRNVPKAYAVIFALVTAYLAYLGIRAAVVGSSDEDDVVSALRNGTVGALAAVVVVIALYSMFGFSIHAFFAHSLGLHASQVTMFRLLIAFVCFGFGAGFVWRLNRLPVA
ncbi:MAG TPA: hypothetical protein VES66_03020 [Terriglobales bacterium]|nr:hypothetical protein [Terriglobales bacterium]